METFCDEMTCRSGCGACCIAITISSPIPGVNGIKLAGQPCPQLTEARTCFIYNSPLKPKVCSNFKASRSVCGEHFEGAMMNLTYLERLTV